MKQFISICLFLSTLCLAVPCSFAAEGPQRVDHGVGFSLSLDYGWVLVAIFFGHSTMLTLFFRTCSVYFANGSAVDVAKVESSTRYKNVMLHIQATDVQYTPSKPPNPNPLLSRLQHQWPFSSFMRIPFARNSLKHWHLQSPDVTAIEDMLLALKTSAESYLGDKVFVADLAVPMPISPRGGHILESASSLLGLERAAGFPIPGALAAMTNGMGNNYQYPESCDTDPSRLILTVDYSRAALTAVLFWEDGCVFERFRVRHGVRLGASALEECQMSTNSADCYNDLAIALRQIVKMPLEDGRSYLPSKVTGLVLLGEKGTDPHLRRILQQVLAEQRTSISSVQSEGGENTMVDPTFAAARGMAAASWGNQNDWQWAQANYEL